MDIDSENMLFKSGIVIRKTIFQNVRFLHIFRDIRFLTTNIINIYFKRCLLKISCSRRLVKPIIISCYRFYRSYNPKGNEDDNLYVRCESVEWGIT